MSIGSGKLLVFVVVLILRIKGYYAGCAFTPNADGHVNIPDDQTSIGEKAFYHCKSLKTVSIPNSVTSIGNDAFRGCTSLETVSIPDSVTSIGENAFTYCSSLETVSIPDSVTTIGSNAFHSTSLETVSFGNSSSLQISQDAFRNSLEIMVCDIFGGLGLEKMHPGIDSNKI